MNTNTIEIERTGRRPLRFTGELLADRLKLRLGTGRSMEAYLYRTKGGKFIAARTFISLWQGDEPRVYDAAIFDTLSELLDWAEAESPIFIRLAQEAGLDTAEVL